MGTKSSNNKDTGLRILRTWFHHLRIIYEFILTFSPSKVGTTTLSEFAAQQAKLLQMENRDKEHFKLLDYFK